MDKRGNFPTAEELLCTLPEKEIDEVPRKVTLSEYLSSPEFQRKRKIESERKRIATLLRKRWLFVQRRNRTRSRVDRDGNAVGRGGNWLLETVGNRQHATLSVFSSQQRHKRYRKSLN